MKTLRWWMAGLTALVLVISPMALRAEGDNGKEGKKRDAKAAQKKDGGDKGEKKGLRGQYAQMVRELGLDEAQQAKLAEFAKAKEQAMNAFQQENGEKMKELREVMKGEDKAKAEQAEKDLKALMAKRGEIEKKHQDAILGILTPEQAKKWQGFQLFQLVMRRYKRLDLSEEQNAKVRELCGAVGADFAAQADKKAKGEMLGKLNKDIAEKVLNDEQRAKMTAHDEKGRDGGKKPEGERKKKDKPAEEKAD